MNRKPLIIYIFLSMVIICTLIVGDRFSADQKTETTKPLFYILGEYKGLLAVYAGGSDIPLEIFDVKISSFPVDDINAVKTGITVSSEEDLQRLIKDFIR